MMKGIGVKFTIDSVKFTIVLYSQEIGVEFTIDLCY